MPARTLLFSLFCPLINYPKPTQLWNVWLSKLSNQNHATSFLTKSVGVNAFSYFLSLLFCARISSKRSLDLSALLNINMRTPLWFSGLLIFRAVAELRISTKSAKSCEIHQNTRNPAKFARNLTKYMSAQYI